MPAFSRARHGKQGKTEGQWSTRILGGASQDLLRASARLAGVTIRCWPAMDLLREYDSLRTLVYADPPYPHGTRVAGSYAHEMSDAQHAELLGVLSAWKGQVLLSTYPCALYDRLLASWVRYEKAVPGA
jgi:DNA adenine methylase